MQDMEQAGDAFNKGNYDVAAKLYGGVPTQYPTSEFIPEAYVQLGYIQYLQGQYDQSVATLDKVAGLKKVQPAQVEVALALAPQVLTAKASKLKADDPARKSTLETAVKKFDEFLQKFPNSTEAETAGYYKAIALNQLARYEEAVTALKANLQKFGTSPTILDSQYLLALTLATAATNKAQAAGPKDPSVDANYNESEKLFTDIITKRTDIALMNDARYQLGELLFARAGFLQDPTPRKTMFDRALEMFRGVVGNEIVVQAQQARVESFRAAKADAARHADLEGIKRWDRVINKELEKLGTFKDRPDETISAKLKVAQIYFQLGKYDECRVLLDYGKSVATDPDQKKQITYFTTLSLAMQEFDLRASPDAAAAKAANGKLDGLSVEAYNQFKNAYPKDQMGDNLALLIGARFIDDDPAKAIDYFKESLNDYPNGRFKIQALTQEAAALAKQKRYDEALDMFKKTLTASPSKDVSAAAEFGIATIHRDTGKGDEAIKEFKEVRDKYAGTPQAEQAAYFVGQMLFEKTDFKGAVTELQSFTKNFPQSALGSNAWYFLGKGQLQIGQKTEGLATLKQVPEKFPKSEVAPFSFFDRATVANNDQNYTECIAIMRAFIQAYPDSPALYEAYDFLAQIDVAQSKVPEAITTYEEYVKAKPEDPNGAKALLRISTLWKGQLEKMLSYVALNEEQRKEWQKNMTGAMTASEQVVNRYPDSPQVALALATLLDCQKVRLRSGLIDDAGVDKYFQDFATKFESNPSTKSKIIFTLASFTFDKDQQKAVNQMAGAYNAKLKYAPEDLDRYGEALIRQKKYDDAQKIFEKLAADYPVPKGIDPANAPRDIAEAQAISLFGLGKVLQEKNKTAEAEQKFNTLKQLYPWSPKMLEANYGIAKSKFEQKAYDDSVTLLIGIARAALAPAELRAKSMMLLANIDEARGDYEAAINNYIKIDAAFGNGVPDLSAEGLFRGAQLLEQEGRGKIPMPTPAPKATPGPKANPGAAAKASPAAAGKGTPKPTPAKH